MTKHLLEGGLMTATTKATKPKEPLLKSARFKVFLAGVILEVLVLFSAELGVEADPELLKEVAQGIAILVTGFIASRTFRNTEN